MRNYLSLVKLWPLVISVVVSIVLFSLNFSTYDSYTHLFFAKHYKENWFSTTDYQLAAGLDMSTYPPLSHQIIALLSLIMPLEFAGSLVTFVSWLLLSYFSSSFFAEYLGIRKDYFWHLFAFVFFSISILKTIFVFGQISTVFSFAFGFVSLKYFTKAIDTNRKKDYLIFLLSFSLVAFSHILSFLIFALSLVVLGLKEIKKAYKNIRPLAACCLAAIAIISLGLLPLVTDMLTGSAVPSKEIPHASRYPLSSAANFDMWVYSAYGLTFVSLILPLFVLRLKIRNKKELLTLYILALFFFLLGLGNNTPLPSLLFKGVDYWLTYDRFSLFSSIFLALLIPAFILYFRFKRTGVLLTALLIIYIIFNLTWLPDTHKMFFGAPVNYQGTEREQIKNYILDFLNNNATTGYRYQTLGLGKPIGQVYLYTKMPTLDTDYFTGRNNLWLRDSGIEEIDTTSDKSVLEIFMQQTSNYSVKYIFTANCIVSCDNFYHNFVKSYGWKFDDYEKFNNSDVVLWINPENISKVSNMNENIDLKNYFWGILPMLTLAVFLMLIFEQKLYKYQITTD